MTRLGRAGAALARLLDRTGVIAEPRLRETVALAWPRIVTGFAIMSKRTVDLAIVGFALGSVAVAGLTLANAFWMTAKFAGIGLAGATNALVSQRYGGDDRVGAARVVSGSLYLGLLVAVPVALAFVLLSDPLVDLVGRDPTAVGYGARYLAVVAPGLVFEYCNLVASRTYAGGSDTRTPMALRAGGAALNVVLSATFVFGADLGVVGAALGTTLSTGAVTVAFAWGMAGRSYLGRGACPVPLTPAALRPDRGTVRELVSVGGPLVARRTAQGLVVFPLLAIAAVFGPVAVAAVGVARQVRALVNSFSWGFSIASSTLVGQALGGGDETGAAAYGREITALSAAVYALAAVAVFVLAGPIAAVFVDRPADLALAADFVRVAAVSVIPLGVDGSVSGALRGAGDTRIPFVATLVGSYAVALPTAWLGTVTVAGVVALQIALLFETTVPMLVNVHRFRTDRWRAVSRAYRPSADD